MLKEMTVSSIIQFIEDNLETKLINIDDLVLYSGYSRRYLQMTFKEYVGIPVGKYIRVRRASRAAALLKLSKMTIIEISEKLFYDSQQTFTREFKKIFGYTPRQYRITPFWSFDNILGRRSINDVYPKPQICYLKGRKVAGKCFDFRELVIYSGVNSKKRWENIYNSLKNNGFVTVSNRIPFHDNDKNILARTVVWKDAEISNCDIQINSGLYAHFSFCGTLDEYVKNMYNIYYNSLPLYKLSKREDYDIEIIKKKENNNITYHYFLPIHCDDLTLQYCEMLSGSGCLMPPLPV